MNFTYSVLQIIQSHLSSTTFPKKEVKGIVVHYPQVKLVSLMKNQVGHRGTMKHTM